MACWLGCLLKFGADFAGFDCEGKGRFTVIKCISIKLLTSLTPPWLEGENCSLF